MEAHATTECQSNTSQILSQAPNQAPSRAQASPGKAATKYNTSHKDFLIQIPCLVSLKTSCASAALRKHDEETA